MKNSSYVVTKMGRDIKFLTKQYTHPHRTNTAHIVDACKRVWVTTKGDHRRRAGLRHLAALCVRNLAAPFSPLRFPRASFINFFGNGIRQPVTVAYIGLSFKLN